MVLYCHYIFCCCSLNKTQTQLTDKVVAEIKALEPELKSANDMLKSNAEIDKACNQEIASVRGEVETRHETYLHNLYTRSCSVLDVLFWHPFACSASGSPM